MTMRPRARNEQPIGSPSWTQRLFSVLNFANIKIVKRVIVSVVGATVLLIGIALLVCQDQRSSLFRWDSPSLQLSTRGRDAGSKELVELRLTLFLVATHQQQRENLASSFAPGAAR